MIATNGILSFALLFVAVAAIFDLRTGHIPNRLTYVGLALGSLLQIVVRCWHSGLPGEPFQLSVLAVAVAHAAFGLLLCGLVPYLLFLRDGIGGGDVKLLAGVGACLGPVVGLEVELYAFIAMALFAPAHLAYQGRLFQVLRNALALLVNPLLPKARRKPIAPELFVSLKFGPAIFVAMAAVALLRWRVA